MRVGWLHDDPGYVGGAELTMREFAAEAPADVELVPCPPGEVAQGLDCYVVGNCQLYGAADVPKGPVVRYHHDVSTAAFDHALEPRLHLFTSPQHYEYMPHTKGVCQVVPPALDLAPYRAVADSKGEGACCVGRMAYGKGLGMLGELERPIDVYSTVPFQSFDQVRYCGPAEDVPAVLAGYEEFVFLPLAPEPFGRAVVEAWAAKRNLLVNRNVGALYYLQHAPEELDGAAEEFWRLVCE